MKWLPKTINDRTALSISIFLSFIIWGSFQMSKLREVDRYIEPKFIAYPGYSLVTEPPQQIELKIQGNGWNLLFLNLNNGDSWVYNLPKRPEIILSESALSKKIKKYFGLTGIHIISVSPAPLIIRQIEENRLRLPLQVKITVEVPQNYLVSGPIKLTPDSVTIYGPVNKLQSLKSWTLPRFRLTKGNRHSLFEKVPLLSKDPELRLTLDSILISVPIEEATEKSLIIPITYDSSTYKLAKFYPVKTKVKLLVPLSKFEKITSHEISASFTPDTINRYATYPLRIKRLPAYVKLSTITPDYVEVYFE